MTRSRNLCAVLLASLLLLSTPFSAGAAGKDDDDQTNTVNLTIQGGDANALATCLNIAKENVRNQRLGTWRWNDNRRGDGNWWEDRGDSNGNWWEDNDRSDDREREDRNRGDGNWWENRDQSNGNWWDDHGRSNDNGREDRGDSNGNSWDDHGRSNDKERDENRTAQENDCDNKAVATGGDVILKNVDILTVQENKGGQASSASQANTVNITIRGGDATALATCLNIAKDKRNGHTTQENDCENKAVATGGNVFIKNVDITIIQKA